VSNQTVQQTLQDEIAGLPDPLAQEALDFILFVKARHAEENYLCTQVEETQRHRQAHPDEVVTATADEWDRLTADEKDAG
jgi:hypothetical protein